MAELNLRDVVDDPSFAMVVRVIANEARKYRKDLTNLDPDDKAVVKKAVIAAAKQKAIRSLMRALWEEAGLQGVIGEEVLDKQLGL